MTFLELYKIDHPEHCGDERGIGCPERQKYEEESDCGESNYDCHKCWAREVPEEILIQKGIVNEDLPELTTEDLDFLFGGDLDA